MRKEFLNQIIYQIFVRNYSKEGNLKAVSDSLDTIISHGADILYLMPIQPIGVLGRKGSKGSPYSIMDYNSIDEEQGSKDDLIELCHLVHQKGKKIILDMVFNHTSRDSLLSKTHPEYFYKNKDGNFANKIGNWDDVIDLDHTNNQLEDYLVDVLRRYESYGIDGFRFDVASFLPPSFYQKARKALKEDTIFLGECIDNPFLIYTRSVGFPAYSNTELALAGIDIFYPYASFTPLREYMETKQSKYLEQYKYALALEEGSLPQGKYITRSIENHDRDRIASFSKNEDFTRSLLLLSFFTMGPAFVYMGEEYKLTHKPDLFEKDVISKEIKDQDYYSYYLKLVSLKKREKNLSTLASLVLDSPEHTLLLKNTFQEDQEEYALLNFLENEQTFNLTNGTYLNLLTGEKVEIKNGSLTCKEPHWLVKLS